MSDCRRTVDHLPSYVDNVLGPEERAFVDRHLAQCPSCHTVLARERGGHAILRRGAPNLKTTPLPPGLRSRCEALVHDHSVHSRRGRLRALVPDWPRSLVPTVLSVILLVFTASAIFSLATRQSDALLAAQLTVDHSKCFKLFVSGESPAMSAEDVEHLLSQQYGWNFHVPPSSGDLQLIGARRCLYADGLIPHVMYRSNGQDLSLFVLNGVTRDPKDLVTFGHRSQIWTRGDTTFVLVSPAEGSDRLADATRYVMKEADR